MQIIIITIIIITIILQYNRVYGRLGGVRMSGQELEVVVLLLPPHTGPDCFTKTVLASSLCQHGQKPVGCPARLNAALNESF